MCTSMGDVISAPRVHSVPRRESNRFGFGSEREEELTVEEVHPTQKNASERLASPKMARIAVYHSNQLNMTRTIK